MQGGNALCHGGQAPAKPWAAWGSLAACHPGGCGWDIIIIIVVIVIIIIISRWKQVCSSSPGHWGASFPIPGLLGAAGWQEQSHPFASCCSPGALICLCFSPGLSRAAKLSSGGAAKKPPCDFMCSQSQTPETKRARQKKELLLLLLSS